MLDGESRRSASRRPRDAVRLAALKHGDVLDNQAYRNATGVDSRVATAELRDLVVQSGTRRWARYQLNDTLSGQEGLPAVV